MNKIKILRDKLKISQIELAARAGISTNTLSLLERDKSENPNKTTLKCIADALGVDISELQGE